MMPAVYNRLTMTNLSVIAFLAGCIFLAMFLFLKNSFTTGLIILLSPFILLFAAAVFNDARVALASVFVINYFALGLVRYVPAPWGLSVDALLLLTWVSLFFRAFNQRIALEKARNSLTLVAAVWYGYIFLQLFNPEAASREAWFYAMRGLAFYKLLLVPLAFILLDHPKYMKMMINTWAAFTVLAVLKAMMQKFMGFDPFEQRWLDAGGALTHIIITGTRYFSFFSDAGNFGASMGFSGVVFSIIALHTSNMKKKIILGGISLLAFYAMLLSGTRGALAVPVGGYFLYTVLTKRLSILIPGIVFLVGMFVFLKFTTIGQDNYEIRRARTALDPDDASFRVRRDNQRLLSTYLASRPFGGGVGSAGNWGQRFTPETFLANIPTDSWYVMIWAETGIIGLLLHISILLFILGKSAWLIMAKLKNSDLIFQLIALTSGMFGMMLASYGNGVLGQMPNGIIIYLSIAFIWMAQDWEKNNLVTEENIS